MLSERYGFSHTNGSDESVNAVWQCNDVLTVQAECEIIDTRTDKTEEFTVFYFVEVADDWKRELSRIVKELGYELNSVKNHEIRRTTIDSFVLYCNGHGYSEND